METDNIDWQSGTLRVVRNDVGQYSIWPTVSAMPQGWYETEMSGSKADCLEYIERHWSPDDLIGQLPEHPDN